MTPHLTQIDHRYGEGVHVLDDPFLTTQLARLCSPETTQPTFNQLVHQLYTSLIRIVISHAFPRVNVAMDTRMKASTPLGVFRGEIVDRQTPTVVVDIARAGILPSQVCYDTFNTVLDPSAVRQDHLIMARTTDAEEQVTGAAVGAHKIGGPIDDCFVLFPDPMGATGNSLAKAIEVYRQFGKARRLITLNLVITPQFIRRLKQAAPEVVIYALRLDRGMSTPDVLATVPGTHWDRESGLDERHYIVPGGGGFGELMNNSWI
ncbi:MAG: uracil phosphoribosyltransferase [Myxococcales bacterium]|nr:uracil phosphoribosyltransferase [Myxococcales bacterium]MCB9524358.1 uracil phosphoribosyltransferase [Myxococcales bacterium]